MPACDEQAEVMNEVSEEVVLADPFTQCHVPHLQVRHQNRLALPGGRDLGLVALHPPASAVTTTRPREAIDKLVVVQ